MKAYDRCLTTLASVWSRTSSSTDSDGLLEDEDDDDWGTKELWKTFQRWGRVVDVFIPLKRNKIGDKFAFIRYQHVRDTKDLEKQLDKMIIGSKKALRQNTNPQRPARGGEDRGKEEDPDWKGMTVRIEEKEWGWLKGAHVGKLRELEMVEGIHDAMQEEGITTIKTLHMGGDLMLLMPLEGEEIMEILKDTEEFFSNWFVYIKPWEENDIAGYHITWLNCGGIPLQAWNESFFKVLTSKFGSFIKTDNETRDRSKIDIARIQIKTLAQGYINTVMRIMINEDSLKNCYKDIEDDFSIEWVPDSLEDQGSPNGVGRGQEEEDEQTERILQLINAVNHGGESFHIENINKCGEVCSFNCSKENNEPPKLATEPNSNGKVVLNYGSGCENGNRKSGPNIETEGVLGAGKFGPDYVLGGYGDVCKGGPSFGIGGIEKDRFLSEGGEPVNENQSPILPLDSNMNGTADLEAAGDERTSNHQPSQQMVHFEKELVDREEGDEGKEFWIDLGGEGEGQSFHEARAKSIDRNAQRSEALQDVPDMSNSQITPAATVVSSSSNTGSISLISHDERRAEAEDLWKIGNLGVSGKGNDDEIIERMIDIEVRDTTDKRRRRWDTNDDK
ncbi:hypothetical protein RIF29_16551 [Crotalaria pallida]|uniref:RRM domain-containing protein n=1 Tax=Crotalaria pallida TaxID=3830 RepID=A0AAN9FGV5_CROPI